MTIRISLDSPGFRLTFSKPFRQATGVTTLETQSRINTKAVSFPCHISRILNSKCKFNILSLRNDTVDFQS